jgi:hypothetical protein
MFNKDAYRWSSGKGGVGWCCESEREIEDDGEEEEEIETGAVAFQISD